VAIFHQLRDRTSCYLGLVPPQAHCFSAFSSSVSGFMPFETTATSVSLRAAASAQENRIHHGPDYQRGAAVGTSDVHFPVRQLDFSTRSGHRCIKAEMREVARERLLLQLNHLLQFSFFLDSSH